MKLALKSGCTNSSSIKPTDIFEILLCRVPELRMDFQRRNSVFSFPLFFFFFPPFPLLFLASFITAVFSMFLLCRAGWFLCSPLPFHITPNGPLRTSRCSLALFMALTSPLKVNSSPQQGRGSFTAKPAAFYKNRKTAAAFIGENEAFSPCSNLHLVKEVQNEGFFLGGKHKGWVWSDRAEFCLSASSWCETKPETLSRCFCYHSRLARVEYRRRIRFFFTKTPFLMLVN